MKFFNTLLTITLAAFATAIDEKTICQHKADATNSGVWCAINNFCNGFGPVLPDMYARYASAGVTCQGTKDGTTAYIRPRGCPVSLGGLSRANCFSAFYHVCAEGGKKGRAEKRMGPIGCIFVGLKDA